jgi:hypothetical protein
LPGPAVGYFTAVQSSVTTAVVFGGPIAVSTVTATQAVTALGR